MVWIVSYKQNWREMLAFQLKIDQSKSVDYFII